MKRIIALVFTLALVTAATPMAKGSSTCQAYHPQSCSASNTHGTTANATTSGSLPFTGLDVVLLVIGGGTLIGAGFVVRRVTRRIESP